MKKFDKTIHELVHADIDKQPAKKPEKEASAVWQALRKTGTHPWLDTGDIEAAQAEWDPAFEALTTNNSLLNREIQKGTYDKLIPRAAQAIRAANPDLSESAMLLEINLVLNARHGLRLARMFDAVVSVELHTDLANDVENSVAYGKRLHALCPEKFMVKVPFTPAGLLAARQLGREGIPVNLTLGFSARQAYLAARVANPRYVNVFLGRLNSFVESSEIGSGEGVGEMTTLAAQKTIAAMREGGQAESRLIAASMRSAEQVPALAGVDVLTMPPKVARAYRESPAERIESQVEANTDATVSMRPGFTTADFNGASLWNLTEPVHCAIANLMAQNVDAMAPDDLIAHFENERVAEFMPKWTIDEIDTIMADGKIPDFGKWRQRLRAADLGLDALMATSALGAFINDQKALDDRILSLA